MPPPPKISPYFRFKRPVDIIGVCIISVVLIPIILVFVLLVRLSSKGPVFYSQLRCGKNSKPFHMIKIRSMIVNAETDGAVWAESDDPRITPVGRVMRKLHIDELVQIYNILRGEMSLVGPRPERPEFVDTLKEQLPGYEHRMLVLPGMSGFAQLNFPGDANMDDVRRKLCLDLEYIETASLGLDVRMLAATWCQFLFTKFSRTLPLKMFGVHRKDIESRE